MSSTIIVRTFVPDTLALKKASNTLSFILATSQEAYYRSFASNLFPPPHSDETVTREVLASLRSKRFRVV